MYKYFVKKCNTKVVSISMGFHLISLKRNWPIIIRVKRALNSVYDNYLPKNNLLLIIEENI